MTLMLMFGVNDATETNDSFQASMWGSTFMLRSVLVFMNFSLFSPEREETESSGVTENSF